MPQTAVSPEIRHIREVRLAAHRLDAVCTAIVGGTAMAVGRQRVEAMEEPLPSDMRLVAEALQRKLDAGR